MREKPYNPEETEKDSFSTTYLHLNNSMQNVMGRVNLSQLSGGKEPPKFDPTTIKTEVHPQSSKFKRSRRPQH